MISANLKRHVAIGWRFTHRLDYSDRFNHLAHCRLDDSPLADYRSDDDHPDGSRPDFRRQNRHQNRHQNRRLAWRSHAWQRGFLWLVTIGLLMIGLFGGARPATAVSFQVVPIISALPPGNAITDGKALLRYALPIDNPPMRTIQLNLENMSDTLRARRKLTALNKNFDTIDKMLTRQRDKILASVPAARQPAAEALLEQVQAGIVDLRQLAADSNKEGVWQKRSELLDRVGEIEELMVAKFPYEVPAEYSYLPQLKGRATIEVKTDKGDMKLVVDGYNAPVTAGNFVDLVQRGFYDGMKFTRAEDFYVLQIGDPPGKEDGFIDPKTDKYRAIPLEVMVEGDAKPTYGVTLEEIGRYLDKPVLPFSAFGALGMARPGDDANGGSSQFFFFLFEPELTPAGLNLLDGRYAVFGYVTENKEVLEQLKQGDQIQSMKVIDGLENLVEPS